MKGIRSAPSKFSVVTHAWKAIGLAAVIAAVACGCSKSPGSHPASPPIPSVTTVVKSVHAGGHATAVVDKSCYKVRPTTTTHTFRNSAAAVTFASANLLPRWTDAPQAFDSIGHRGGAHFYMRSMSRADVVALKVNDGRWLIAGTGHC